MSAQLPPGLGNDQQALQATAFIRQQPWYLQWIKSLGKTPDANGNVQLNDQQANQLRDMATKSGIGFNNKYDGIDSNGQIVEEHHKLRNGLLAAAIAAAGATGLGAAGIGPLSGLFGAGAGAAGAGTGASMAAIPATEGIASATALGLPATAGLGSAGAAAAGLGAGMSTIPELGALNSADLPGYMSTEGIFNSMPGAVAGPGVAGMSQGGGSLMEKILTSLKNPSNLANIGSLLGSFSSGEKANRVTAAQMIDQYNKDMLSAQTNRNETESDAMKKLAQTGYLLNGHQGYTPPTVQMNGASRQLPDFGFGYTAPTDAQKSGATSLQAQLGDRLKPGGTYTPIKPQMDPGTAENIGSYGGVGAGLLGGALNGINPQSDAPDYSNIGKTILGLFK